MVQIENLLEQRFRRAQREADDWKAESERRTQDHHLALDRIGVLEADKAELHRALKSTTDLLEEVGFFDEAVALARTLLGRTK